MQSNMFYSLIIITSLDGLSLCGWVCNDFSVCAVWGGVGGGWVGGGGGWGGVVGGGGGFVVVGGVWEGGGGETSVR